jgi:hypothetical protein
VKTLLLTIIKIVEGPQHDLQIARQFFFAEEKRSAGGAGAFIA